MSIDKDKQALYDALKNNSASDVEALLRSLDESRIKLLQQNGIFRHAYNIAEALNAGSFNKNAEFQF